MELTDDIFLADFLGKRIWSNKELKDGREQQWHFRICDGYYPTINTMRFKTSWDWIMEVVSRIASLMPEIQIPRDLDDLKYRTHAAEEYIKVLSMPIARPHNEVYSACVSFVKWYNEKHK